MDKPSDSNLGKASTYQPYYAPEKLFLIPRAAHRANIGIDGNAPLPFYGTDTWHHYEVSFLDLRGKPQVALAKMVYGADSVCMIESKSMKEYFHSFNNEKFKSLEALEAVIHQDLEKKMHTKVSVTLTPVSAYVPSVLERGFEGISLDHLDVACSVYEPDADLLRTENTVVLKETLCSDLLKSNCLVTGQPDWASVWIDYSGKKIQREALLQYVVSYRNHQGFHEQCVEQIFMDILRVCEPSRLTVYARYTRRGGIDINPFRSTDSDAWIPSSGRLCRQ